MSRKILTVEDLEQLPFEDLIELWERIYELFEEMEEQEYWQAGVEAQLQLSLIVQEHYSKKT